MLKDNKRYKYLRAILCIGAVGVAFQVTANPFGMGRPIAYSSEQWPERWSSALSSSPIRSVAAVPAATSYQPVPNIAPYYNPYGQATSNAPHYGFNERKVVRPWGELPRKSRNKNTKRKQRYEREKYRMPNRYNTMAYPQALPISNPYLNSFPYAGGIYPGLTPGWGSPGLSPGLVSPYGIAPFGGVGTAWPISPGLW